MKNPIPFVDIHCHLLPALDDGPGDWDEALAMAEIAAADGIAAIVATPHQLGGYLQNTPEKIRDQVKQFQRLLQERDIGLELLPGADVRIEPDLPYKIQTDRVLTLADRRRHVLLELPHEVYISLDRLLADLHAAGLTGILSHPERNRGILAQPHVLEDLVRQGCLLQVTAGSLLGFFGPQIQKFTETIIRRGLVHFIATDAHGIKSRTPVLSQAFQRTAELVGLDTAIDLCCRNPTSITSGRPIIPRVETRPKAKNPIPKSYFFHTVRQFVFFN
jgi:protein-tyrosine phosphatase